MHSSRLAFSSLQTQQGFGLSCCAGAAAAGVFREGMVAEAVDMTGNVLSFACDECKYKFRGALSPRVVDVGMNSIHFIFR